MKYKFDIIFAFLFMIPSFLVGIAVSIIVTGYGMGRTMMDSLIETIMTTKE